VHGGKDKKRRTERKARWAENNLGEGDHRSPLQTEPGVLVRWENLANQGMRILVEGGEGPKTSIGAKHQPNGSDVSRRENNQKQNQTFNEEMPDPHE